MPILKCKMCGGDLNIEAGMTVCECEYCNTKQTVPTIDDEKKVKLFERANRFRMDCQFDKAATVYESIIEEFDAEAEGYWGLLLCKYGIEYVDDPATGDKVPTCHRSSFDSFMDDRDFESVMDYSDSISRSVYRDQAKQIEEIRKGIIEVSGKEEPYDIFICYKETADDGQRTIDSVLAQDVYDILVDKGYRVFFSRITLEDKLGTEYEPYIFAALNSAKIMLAFGTSYDYYNAVWVKNEWSRYLKLMAKDKAKYLIPCYKDIDAYDIPKEFAKLQAQDLGKVGATQDLIRGIEKILPKKTEVVKEPVVVQSGNGTSVDKMLERGQLALEDNDWQKADSFFEEALNQNPKCAEAYLGKLLAESKCVTFEDYKISLINKYEDATTEKLYACDEEITHINSIVKESVLDGYLDADSIKKLYAFDRSYSSALSCRKEHKRKQQSEIDSDKLFARVRQYAAGELKEQIESGIENIVSIHDARIAEEQKSDEAKITEITANYQIYIENADKKVRDMRVKADKEKFQYYESVVAEMNNASTVSAYEDAIKNFSVLGEYEDSSELVRKCQAEIDKIKNEERKEKERLARNVKNITIISVFAILAVIAIIIIVKVVIPANNYNKAIKLKDNGQYSEAITIFENLNGYKDSDSQILDCNYKFAISMIESGRYQEAADVFESLNEYKDSYNQMLDCNYYLAIELMNNGQYSEAITVFERLDDYRDSNEQIYNLKSSPFYISTLSIGDTFLYGNYNNQPLEWTILDVYENQVFAVTTNAVCERQYSISRSNSAWANCNLRVWLNRDFFNESFNLDEQARILSTDISTTCHDNLFLLSAEEVSGYFDSRDSKVCEFNGQSCLWWLRTQDNGRVCVVERNGNVYSRSTTAYSASFYYADMSTIAVRPAMWIDIS